MGDDVLRRLKGVSRSAVYRRENEERNEKNETTHDSSLLRKVRMTKTPFPVRTITFHGDGLDHRLLVRAHEERDVDQNGVGQLPHVGDRLLESNIVEGELVVKIVVDILLSFGGVVNELGGGREEGQLDATNSSFGRERIRRQTFKEALH